MNKKIKILFVLSNLRPSNGVASFAMTYFRMLDKNKYQIDFSVLYNYPSPYYQEIRKAGGKVFLLPSLHKPLTHIKACRKILLENNYQIIHDNLLISSLPMMTVAKSLHIPVRILQSHNTKLSSIKWKEIRNKIALPLLIKTANTYFACSNAAGRAMFGKKDFTVIPNTVSSNRFCFNKDMREHIREKYNCKGKIVIGTVARVTWQKNPFFAIRVIKNLVEKNPKFQYWWIGSGELDKQVQKYIDDNNLNDSIKMFGSCDDVSSLYQAMDIFFLPSLFEGLPITAIEAQAAGLPCVISDSVTKELVYTDLVQFVSLNSSLSVWCNQIIKQSIREVNRTKYLDELKVSPFYSLNATKLLSKYYLKLVRKKSQNYFS